MTTQNISQPERSIYEISSAAYPGKILGMVAVVLSFLNLIGIPSALIGAILGHVAYSQGKRAGFKNTPALVAIIAGWVLTGLFFLILLSLLLLFALVF